MEFTQRKKDEIKAQSIDINSLILDIVELTKPRWKDMAETEGKEIKILTNLGNIPLIKGNRVELESAILNVIYNSIEAIENKGTIQISTYFKEQKVFIEVKDTGKGIEPENIGKVFDPFFTTKGTIGTGFGLTISYNNVKKHGGEIEIESEKGKGTKITITLPIF
jgi:Signal transduction histidine kinase